jgi:hypothetical protein
MSEATPQRQAAVARTLFGQLWEEWRFNSVREELEVMEKEFPWLKCQD